jgi:ubiquinone/menaquinone biosynthesis C-methylase UbiE
MNDSLQHDADILDQFTRQAVPFAERHASDDELMRLLVEISGVGPRDDVLDIACGPGLVSCAFASCARQVTGLDLVPAMLDRARVLQENRKLTNVVWKRGSATALPFADAHFDCVVTRFSFHHYLNPAAALREMGRVSRPSGIVLVIDVAPRPDAQDAYNAMEKLRDPSHARALTEVELKSLAQTQGMKLERQASYRLESDLEGLLQTSFPREGDANKIRDLFEEDIRAGDDRLGVGAHRRNGEIYFYFPVVALAWRKG